MGGVPVQGVYLSHPCGVPAQWGVYLPSGGRTCPGDGVYLPRGVYLPHTPTPVDRILDTHITFPQLHLWTVTMITRMHSSRMHTIHSSSCLWGGGVCLARGVCLAGGGGSALPGGGIPACNWADPPPREQNDWQTGVKT